MLFYIYTHVVQYVLVLKCYWGGCHLWLVYVGAEVLLRWMPFMTFIYGCWSVTEVDAIYDWYMWVLKCYWGGCHLWLVHMGAEVLLKWKPLMTGISGRGDWYITAEALVRQLPLPLVTHYTWRVLAAPFVFVPLVVLPPAGNEWTCCAQVYSPFVSHEQ